MAIDTKELRRLALEGDFYAIYELLDRLEAWENVFGHLGTPDEVGNEWHKLTDRLEAAESDGLEQARLNGIGAEKELALMAKLEAAEKEIRLLRAKVETMEKQEPVAWVRKLGLDLPSVVCVTDLKYRPSDTPESSYIPLYLAPGAQPAPSIPEGWMLVPVEPTEVMITAALGEFHMLNIRRVMACYDAMLAAAPGAKGE